MIYHVCPSILYSQTLNIVTQANKITRQMLTVSQASLTMYFESLMAVKIDHIIANVEEDC